MSYSPYTLDIVSQHPKFSSKTLRKYNVDGIETVGAWGNEPFEIRFKNNTWKKIQVKLSIDGTDIMTGDLASTEPTEKMWLVDGGASLTLKAWPENNNGGARFVFTSGEKGVAANTHGDVSNRGIIAAAVYVEGAAKPIVFYHSPVWETSFYTNNARRCVKSFDSTRDDDYITKSVCSSDQTLGAASAAGSSMDLISEMNSIQSNSIESNRELKSQASVGAGEYVNQNIKYVEGLIKPVFTEAVRVRYIWWDELQSKLKETYRVDSQPSGFPADKTNIDLGNTPRIKTAAAPSFKRSDNPEFLRF